MQWICELYSIIQQIIRPKLRWIPKQLSTVSVDANEIGRKFLIKVINMMEGGRQVPSKFLMNEILGWLDEHVEVKFTNLNYGFLLREQNLGAPVLSTGARGFIVAGEGHAPRPFRLCPCGSF